MSDALTEIACPNCLNPIDIREHGRHVTCDACQSKFLLEGHICPVCNTYHTKEQGFCKNCGEALTRRCQKCNTVNWTGDEYCKQCGAALDIFQMLHMHHKQATEERLNEQMRAAKAIKDKEFLDSEQRMADMMANEKQRLQTIARRRAEQKKKDQQIIAVIVVVAIFILFLAFVSLLLF